MSEAQHLRELAQSVTDEAHKTAYALMHANYVERKAPELMSEGVIRGLAPQARDIAASLRDSIWSRFESLRFHQGLLVSVRKHQAKRFGELRSTDPASVILTASWQAHYLFDDLVFNSASFFDYLGNAIWFGFHGQNHIKKKWSRTYDAAKDPQFEEKLPRGARIHGSATGAIVREVHEDFVDDLYRYRSDLIHHSIDGPDVFSHSFWEESSAAGARLLLPRTSLRRLGHVLAGTSAVPDQVDMIQGGERLITQVGKAARRLMTALREDLDWVEGEPLTLLSS